MPVEPFRIHILGCGSALPTARHNASAQVVEMRGKMMMIDCGEGAQMQIRHSHINFNKIMSVFITHLHGDHCFGLIGMISTFGLLGRTAPLHVYAPAALEPLLQQQLRMFCQGLEYDVAFHAVNTKEQRVVYEDRSLTVETIPLEHRIPCCGYLFREKAGRPHLRRDVFDRYQIDVSQIDRIKGGADGVTPQGQVVPHQELTLPPDPPRSYAYCSDTRYIPTLHERVRGVTLLYHESTYAHDRLDMAEKYYHSTARQAAQVARDAGVGRLFLGHYSSRYDNEQVLLDEARSVFASTDLANEQLVVDL